MKKSAVTMVRIYLTEAEGSLEQVMTKLHDQEKVRGVTVFRGIGGFGRSGKMHTASLLDLSLDLPLVVEFFDGPEKVRSILEHLQTILPPGHVVSWSAEVNEE